MNGRPGIWRAALWALLLGGILGACAAPGGPMASGAVSTGVHGGGIPTVTRHILSLSRLTPSPQPTATRSARPRATATPTIPAPIATKTPTRTPTITPIPTEIFQLCSPLLANSIDELPKIVSDPYDPPKSWGSDERHHGVDFAYHRWKDSDQSILGTGVQSALKGQVSAALADTYPYGNLVIVETKWETLPPELAEALEISPDQSLYLLYAHLDGPPLVSLGDEVAACQLIGAVGRSGNAQVAHLHFETRRGPPGAVFKGLSRFVDSATEEEKANYTYWRVSGTFRHFDPMCLLLFYLGAGK